MVKQSAAMPVVLMTGSSGLIGSRLAVALRDGYRVVGLDLKPPQGEVALKFLECDLTSEESLAQTLDRVALAYGGRLASVVHLAAHDDLSGESRRRDHELNIQGTQRFLEQLRAKFAAVEQLVFTSSLLVMKPAEDHKPLTENSPTQAESDHPQSKLEAESIIDRTAGDIPVVVLRIANVYDDRCHSFPIGQQIAHTYEGRLDSYFVAGDRDAAQSFIHVEDLADCIRKVVDQRGELGRREVFLIGEETVLSYGEIQDHLGEMLRGRELPALPIPKIAAKAGAWVHEMLTPAEEAKPLVTPSTIDLADQDYRVDVSRARERLGWTPTRTLRDTLENMVELLDRDPEAWYRENDLPLPENLEQLKHEDD